MQKTSAFLLFLALYFINYPLQAMNDPNEDQERSLSSKSALRLSLDVEGKLTKEECETLKTISSLLTQQDPSFSIPIPPRLGWIKAEELEDLKVLCDLDEENKKKHTIKNYQSTKQQIQKAMGRLYHLTENLLLKGLLPSITVCREEMLTTLFAEHPECCGASSGSRVLSEAILKSMSGMKQSLHHQLDNEVIFPYIPIVQKMMRNIIRYVEKTEGKQPSAFSGAIPLEGGQYLGYTQGYLPVSFDSNPSYEVIRLPYTLFSERGQGVCIVKDGKIVEDSGLVIDHKDVLGFSLLQSAFVYCGIDSSCPFTMSPFELVTSDYLGEKSSKDILLKDILGEEYPSPGKASFISLPLKDEEKDLLELLFLEDLQEQAQKGDKDAIRMIAYIEAETKQDIAEIIEDLTNEQLRIIEEQAKISKDVVENRIEGRIKNKNKSSHGKRGKTKQEASHSFHNSSSNNNTHKSIQKNRDIPNIFKDQEEKGRQKYRKVIGVINRIMKNSLSHQLTEGNKGGSHKTFHSEKGAATLVKAHGKKDLTISSKTSKRFYEKLITLLN